MLRRELPLPAVSRVLPQGWEAAEYRREGLRLVLVLRGRGKIVRVGFAAAGTTAAAFARAGSIDVSYLTDGAANVMTDVEAREVFRRVLVLLDDLIARKPRLRLERTAPPPSDSDAGSIPPAAASLEIEFAGGDCGLRCVFCASKNGTESARRLARADRSRLFEAILKQCDPERYGRYVIFTGSDPLASKRIFEAAGLARRVGFDHVRVLASGVRVLEKGVLDRLIRSGVTELWIPLYGTTAAVHDAVTGTRGSFERLLAALGVLRSTAGAPAVTIQSLLLKQNLAEAARLPGFAKKNLRVPKMTLQIPFPYSSKRAAYSEFCPSPAEVRKALGRTELDGVLLIDIPICLLPAGKAGAGTGGIPPARPSLYLASNAGAGREPEPHAPWRAKAFADCCGRCAARNACPGVYAMQLEIFGSRALHPLSSF